MADKSAIEWTDATWNPIVGCSIVSPGCTHCYAMGMAARIEAMTAALVAKGQTGAPHYNGTTKKVNGHTVWTGKVALAPLHILTEPLNWRAPRRIFVNSMGDLFHEDVPSSWIDHVFATMALSPQHTFQVLTKRANRMREYMTTPDRKRTIAATVMDISELLARQAGTHKAKIELDHFSKCFAGGGPFANVWLGVSAERQQEADERIPDLLATPAAVRFVSAEPLLGPINIVDAMWAGNEPAAANLDATIDWIIVGGESGPEARPMHPGWARSIRDQCQAAGTAFFFKQWGAFKPLYDRDIDDPDWRRCGIVAQETPRGQWLNLAGGQGFHGERVVRMDRVGKKAAGRQLDGGEHNAMPEAR